MNSRERVRLALEHKAPDRVPLDLGGTVVTGIHIHAYRRFREALGLPPREVRIGNLNQQLAVVDDDVVDLLGVDVKGVAPGAPSTFQLETRDTEHCTYFYDELGIGWQKPKERGLYYDLLESPLSGDITEETIERHPWPDPTDPSRYVGLREAARRIAEEEKRAVVVANMLAGFVETCPWLLGFEQYFLDLAANHSLLGKLMDKLLEIKAACWERTLREVGEYVDVIVEAEDFAGQDSLLMSPKTWRKLIKPRLQEFYGWLHQQTGAKLFLHSCGAVREVIPDLIEVGVDILNPVQVSAVGMDSAELKREFGKDLVFWGGGVDTQRVLGTGSPDEVRAEVRRRLRDFMPGGGFVFATVHNIQPNVPPENLLAMFETVREYGTYS
ncbi:MAG: uroporphyrinogen decarboxylase family protein [Anaerolineae bacterium]